MRAKLPRTDLHPPTVFIGDGDWRGTPDCVNLLTRLTGADLSPRDPDTFNVYVASPKVEARKRHNASVVYTEVGQSPLERYLPSQADGLHGHICQSSLSFGGANIKTSYTLTEIAKATLCSGCRRY